MTAFIRQAPANASTEAAYHWIVRRSSRDCWNPIAFEPLVMLPASPPSNVWQAQNAMIELQRRGIACYMDMITVYEEVTG